MCLLFETIKVFERKLFNIDYHNQRFNRTRRLLFGSVEEIDLNKIISIPDDIDKGLYKCRITYDEKEFGEAEFSPYKLKRISSLKIVHCEKIDYSFKYSDRSVINDLLSKKGNCDDILIIKNGFVTDTSICNIVFYDGTDWITSSTPLLKGTMRTKLMQGNKIIEKKIKEKDLKRYRSAALINAFRDLGNNQIPMQNIE